MLANRLSGLGSNVVIVDRDEAAFDNLSVEFSGFRVRGEAAELATLRQANIERADCLLAVTPHDNVNLMVAQMAQVTFGVPKVMARVFDPAREGVYREFMQRDGQPGRSGLVLVLNNRGLWQGSMVQTRWGGTRLRPVAWRGSEMMAVAAQHNRIHVAIATWAWPSMRGPPVAGGCRPQARRSRSATARLPSGR